MEWLIWGGAALTLLGLAGLMRCVLLALATRRETLPEAELSQRFRRIALLNMAALGVSALGLMVVVAGILLR